MRQTKFPLWYVNAIYGNSGGALYRTFLDCASPPTHLRRRACAVVRRCNCCKVRLPLAFPEIMLGVNQTILFSLFMAVIAAFIGGSKHLGPEFFKAMAHSDIGKALVLGLCVAFMGLIADRLITGWVALRKQQLGVVA